MTIKIITNNVPRPVVNAWELTAAERAEFDYYDWAAVERGETSPEFVRYKGDLIDISEFQTTSGLHQMPEVAAWDGYQSDSFFSGLVIRWPREGSHIDFEAVIVGRYMS